MASHARDAAPRSVHRSGVLLTLVSALVFSTAGLFSKGVAADAWSIIYWRGLFAALFTLLYILWRGALTQEVTAMGRAGLAASVLGAVGTAAFIPAFKMTTIANVSLIYASSPFVAAAVAWLWFRETPKTAVLVSSIIAFCGVLMIVHGSVSGAGLSGDFLALAMTIAIATMIVIYRRYPATPAAGPAALSSLLLLPFALVVSDPFAVSLTEIAVMAAFGLVFAVASVTLSEGARRLPPGEAALLSALETPLAPIWAWLMFSEAPAAATLIGGAIILAAVFGSQMLSLREEKAKPAASELRG